MKCDALIIGAGLSGATCGFLLSKAGYTVLVVDRADLTVKDKLCGGMVTARSLEAIERIFGSVPPSLYRESFDTMSAIDTRVRKGNNTATLPAHMRIVRRRELDAYVVGRLLDAGGMLADRSHLASVDTEHRTAIVSTPTGPLNIDYLALIVADGASSPTRRKLSALDPTLKPKPSIPLVPSLEAQVKPTGALPTGWYVPSVGGYCWYFPCGDDANIGIAGFKASSAELRSTLNEFATMVGVSSPFESRGAFIPSGGDYLLQSRDAFFIGDAAGLVCPVTWEGIYYALQSAWELATCLKSGASYLEAMRPHLRTLSLQYASSKALYNDQLTLGGVRAAETLGVDLARIPELALRFTSSYAPNRT